MEESHFLNAKGNYFYQANFQQYLACNMNTQTRVMYHYFALSGHQQLLQTEKKKGRRGQKKEGAKEKKMYILSEVV